MMTPVCGEKPGTGHFWMMGSGGAGRIPYALAQVILRAGMGGMSLRDSIELPRMHFAEDVFNVEPRFADNLPAKVSNYPVREWLRPSLYFGGVHAVEFNSGKLDAHADSRRDGVYLVKA
jgi:gamma-glutamyltranspeptidase/glutathione hydrolase